MEYKSFSTVANLASDTPGTIHAVVSVFGNRDYGDDVCVKGCFAKNIEQAKIRSRLPKMIWSHDLNELPLGKTIDLFEDNDGLHVIGQFCLEDPRAKSVYEHIKFGSLNEYSFGYSVEDEEHKS